MSAENTTEIPGGLNPKSDPLMQMAETMEKSRKFAQTVVAVVFTVVGAILLSVLIGVIHG